MYCFLFDQLEKNWLMSNLKSSACFISLFMVVFLVDNDVSTLRSWMYMIEKIMQPINMEFDQCLS